MESGLIRRLMRGTPIVSGPRQVTVNRDEDESGATVLRVSHDGYVEEFGILHQRALMLSADGKRLDGEELFTAMHGEALASQDQFAVRFHLHPLIKANRLSDSHGAMLLLPNKDVWTFNAYEDRIDIEESVYLAGNEGPRRTTQIVIHGRARKVARIQWTLSLTAASPVGSPGGRGETAPSEKRTSRSNRRASKEDRTEGRAAERNRSRAEGRTEACTKVEQAIEQKPRSRNPSPKRCSPRGRQRAAGAPPTRWSCRGRLCYGHAIMTENLRRITRALISVSDKTGLVDFARALATHGIELISTGGTKGTLAPSRAQGARRVGCHRLSRG
jgi:hypothetical protein